MWREAHGYSLRSLAEKLGVASSSTISAWEGGQPIPEVTQKVLRWLMRGEVPFASECDGAGLGERVEMTVDAFEECLRLARAGGFGSVTEWIADLVRAELGSKPDGVNNPDQPNTRVDYLRTDGRGWKKPFREVEMTFPSLEAAVEAAMTKI